jgi:GDPmannose 4,6-dehydratase
MLQQEKPSEYVIATGQSHSVREFLEAAFGRLQLDPYQYLLVDENLVRPADVDRLVGDATKARTLLGWNQEISFDQLVDQMIDADMRLYSQGK